MSQHSRCSRRPCRLGGDEGVEVEGLRLSARLTGCECLAQRRHLCLLVLQEAQAGADDLARYRYRPDPTWLAMNPTKWSSRLTEVFTDMPLTYQFLV